MHSSSGSDELPPGNAPPFPSRRRLGLELGLVLLLALAAILRSAWGTRLDGVTVDEPWHIVAGVEYVRTGDFRLNPEHPPLTKLWVGAAISDSFKLRPKTALGEKNAERNLVEETFFLDNDFRAAQQQARRAMFLFHFLLLVAAGILLCRACGLAWAVGTLLFVVLEPTVGAHLPVVMTDLPLALTLLLAALCAARLADGWQWRWAAAAGLAMGLALATKHSALPGLAGIFLYLLAAAAFTRGAGDSSDLRHPAPRVLRLLLAAAIALGLLWACYGFHFHAAGDGSDLFNREMPDKIEDLQIPVWHWLIGQADHWRLLPRSYLWGLADTVRAGVEGRGQNLHFLWGRNVEGAPPWYTWPSFLLSKVPLALLALAAAGVVVLAWARPAGKVRALLGAVGAMAAVHLLALASSQGSYAGVRHALPLTLGLAVLAGAAFWLPWRLRSRPGLLAAGGLLAIAAAMTLGEPRLWEYHNELAGGSAGAWRYFRNEGIDLGQRSLEIENFYRLKVAPTGFKLYSDYWIAEEQARALGIHFGRRVESLDDVNLEGLYEGFFVYQPDARLPKPELDWDPARELAGLTPVARFGEAEIWFGRQISPRSRAGAMRGMVLQYIYQRRGSNWPLVAQRLEEVLAVNRFDFSVAIELGNAYLRQGLRAEALRAYRQPFAENDRHLLDEITRENLERRIASLEGGEPLEILAPLRNPWME